MDPVMPIGWHTEDYLTDKSATTYDPVVAERWESKGWPVRPLFSWDEVSPIALRAKRMEAEIRLFIEWHALRSGPDDAMLPKNKQPAQIRALMDVIDWE